MSDEEKSYSKWKMLIAAILFSTVIIFAIIELKDGIWVASPVIQEVVLTPDAPRSGDSWVEVRIGFNMPGDDPDGSYYWRQPHSMIWSDYAGEKDVPSPGVFVFHFEPTVPGEVYLLKLVVFCAEDEWGEPEWIFSGAIEGELAAVQETDSLLYSLVTAFIADSTVTEIRLEVKDPGLGFGYPQEGYFYSCHLTHID